MYNENIQIIVRLITHIKIKLLLLTSLDNPSAEQINETADLENQLYACEKYLRESLSLE